MGLNELEARRRASSRSADQVLEDLEADGILTRLDRPPLMLGAGHVLAAGHDASACSTCLMATGGTVEQVRTIVDQLVDRGLALRMVALEADGETAGQIDRAIARLVEVVDRLADLLPPSDLTDRTLASIAILEDR